MSIKILIGGMALCCVATPAAADCFRSELSLAYLDGETAGSRSSYRPPTPGTPPAPPTGPTPPREPETGVSAEDYDGFAAAAEIFLQPVSCDRGPLDEAAFLSKASSLGGSYRTLEGEAGQDFDSWSLFTRIIVNDWVLEGGAARTELDNGFVDSEVDSYRVAAGRYLGDASQLRLRIESSDDEFVETQTYTVDIKHVAQLENGMSYNLNALASILSTDVELGEDADGYGLTLDGDWYFTDQFSIGAVLGMTDLDGVGTLVNYELNSTYYFTSKISAAVRYQDVDDDALQLLGDSLIVEFRYRL